MNIIVVEDHYDLRLTFVEHLLQEGYKVWGVSCGEDLNTLLATHSVDLLLLDVNLPGENGFQIARRLRDTHPNINIIMLTVKGAETDRINGYESGADIYLAKPVSPAELSAVVRSVFRRMQCEDAASSVLELDVRHMNFRGQLGNVSLNKLDVALIKTLAV